MEHRPRFGASDWYLEHPAGILEHPDGFWNICVRCQNIVCILEHPDSLVRGGAVRGVCYLEHTQDGPRSNTYDPTPSIAPRTSAHARTPKQEQHISKAAAREMSHDPVYIANGPKFFWYITVSNPIIRIFYGRYWAFWSIVVKW